MIKVHLKSGKTLSYDLSNEHDSRLWQKDSSSVVFQSDITGIGIIFKSQWFALPLPKRFRQFHFVAELVSSNKANSPSRFTGERIKCYADDILISVQVYWSNKPKMSRIDVVRVGKRRFNPELRNMG